MSSVKLRYYSSSHFNFALEMKPCLCEGAFEALLAGRTDQHDCLVSDAIKQLARDVDVVVLAQASMARLVAELPVNGRAILSSPRLAVESVRERLLGFETNGV